MAKPPFPTQFHLPGIRANPYSQRVMTSTPRYHINVFWYPDDACWIADVPDLRPCSAHGDTPVAAVREVCVAIEGWLETARANDLPVPEPRYSPALHAARL